MKSVLVFLAILVVGFALGNLVGAALNKAECDAKTSASALEARFSYFGGCQVKDANGVWISLKQYQAVAVQ